jgi:hypothetical protein
MINGASNLKKIEFFCKELILLREYSEEHLSVVPTSLPPPNMLLFAKEDLWFGYKLSINTSSQRQLKSFLTLIFFSPLLIIKIKQKIDFLNYFYE